MNSPEQSVGDLAIALGGFIGAWAVSDVEVECFIESVLVLAFKAGVNKTCALQPFDCHPQLAAKIWSDLENQGS